VAGGLTARLREEVTLVSVSAPREPDADPRTVWGDGMYCGECGGFGVIVDAAPAGGGLWVIQWRTEHGRGCAGRRWPDRVYLVDVAALAAGDFDLPGLP
jgi:hypothetical protein